MIGALLSGLLLLVRPDAMGAEVLLAAGLLVGALAVAAVLRLGTRASGPRLAIAIARAGFADVRVLLRASDPDAAGHRRARAPGATR